MVDFIAPHSVEEGHDLLNAIRKMIDTILGRPGLETAIILAGQNLDASDSSELSFSRGNMAVRWPRPIKISLSNKLVVEADFFASILDMASHPHLLPTDLDSQTFCPLIYESTRRFIPFHGPKNHRHSYTLLHNNVAATKISDSEPWIFHSLEGRRFESLNQKQVSQESLNELGVIQAQVRDDCNWSVFLQARRGHLDPKRLRVIPFPVDTLSSAHRIWKRSTPLDQEVNLFRFPFPSFSLDEIAQHIKPLPHPYPPFDTKAWPPGKSLPTAFFLGTPKSATTSLHGWLSLHPNVLETLAKEPQFFASSRGKGMGWYSLIFPQDPNPGRNISLDASTRYLGWCTAPMDVKAFTEAFNIRPKFIISVRDPVARIYSHHAMRMRNRLNKGQDLGGMLERNLEELEECVKSHSKEEAIRECYCLQKYPNYITETMYDFHILRWKSVFPTGDFLIVHIEDIKENPTEVMRQIESFLGLPHFDYGDNLGEPKNTNEKIDSSRLPSEHGPYLASYFESTVKNTEKLTGITLPTSSIYQKEIVLKMESENRRPGRRKGLVSQNKGVQ